MMDGCETHIRYKKGGNALCELFLDGMYLGVANRQLEAAQRSLVADAIRGASAAAPPADCECPRICRLRCSRARWLKLHGKISDCGWVGSCCRHLVGLWGGFASMPAPECHLFYFYILDQIVMEGGDEHVHLLHLDIGCAPPPPPPHDPLSDLLYE